MNRLLDTKLKPSKVLGGFANLVKASKHKSALTVANFIGDSLNEEPADLSSKIDTFIRSFGLMEFIGVCK